LRANDLVIELQTGEASIKTLLDEKIANALVDNAVNDGFLISVNNWAETVVNRSRNIPEITKAMFSTHMDTLTLSVEEKRVGMITLIYGNGSNGLDVIGGHTDIPHINRLVEHTLKEFEQSSTPSLQGPDEPPIGHLEDGYGWRSFCKLTWAR
jgi:hypothetical protein